MTDSKPWPCTVARSTGTQSKDLLYSLLATADFDEISSADDFNAVKEYISGRGAINQLGLTTVGLTFWVYPTGLHGPYHITDEGNVEEHGLLLTVESGVAVGDIVEHARAGLKETLVHEHIGSAAA
ncbi:hypothetical protein PUNSTDRAFT_129151 [Punctularia strigosozonata HHB-11173 SS5]|uniref:uncharacterized protein n=1 Tax=Punctularia strigosozonata (strain HHB-11173) TaxID=741275 RepID=UPI0004416BB0|nr:uncharacterized protein PUNSTDRAFT_129151 [Punctularia strigosozonata HHB-11173 SS5]EIN13469.1 hypothetical protein PUNSTDRAFT_129151 [Punctularia strigosozonata HHB-11173 SS5]